MQNRFGSCEDEEICLATILDPRFKNIVFSNSTQMQSSGEKLILKCEETPQPNEIENATVVPSPKRAWSKQSDADNVLWAKVDDMMKEYDSEPDDDYSSCEEIANS